MIKLKFNWTLLIIILCTLTMLSSCDDDITPVIPSNSFTVSGGFTAEISQGYLEEFKDNGNGSFAWFLILVSEGFDIQTEGNGSLIDLELNSNSESGLTAGTYNWSDSSDSFTLVYSEAAVNFDFGTGLGDYHNFNGTGGTVIISFDGADTIVDFELTMSDGNEVKGYYRGILEVL